MSNLKDKMKPSTSQANPTIKDIQCRKCCKDFKSNSILKHLSQSKKQNCIAEYTEEEINDFKKNSKELSVHKKQLWKEKNKDHEAEYQAKYQAKKYQENRDNIILQRKVDTKAKNKEKTIKEHENNLQKYKEKCENFAREQNNMHFSFHLEEFNKKVDKLKLYIDPDRIEHVQKEFDSIQTSIKDTFQELETLINHAVIQVKDEKENWDTVAATFSTLFHTFETSHLMWHEKPKGKLMIDQKWDAMKKKIENDIKIIQRDEVNYEKVCQGCKKSYQINTILPHLGRNSQCEEKYTNDELKSLRSESKERTKFKKQIWQETNKEHITKQNANYYKETIPRKETERLMRRKDNTLAFYKYCQEEKCKSYLENEITYFELSILERMKLLKSKLTKKENLDKLIQVETDMKEKVTCFKEKIDEASKKALNLSCPHDVKDCWFGWGDHGCVQCSKEIDKLYSFLEVDERYSEDTKRLKNFYTFFKEIFKSLNDIVEEENVSKEILQIWDEKRKEWNSLVRHQYDFQDVLKNTKRLQDPHAQELSEDYYNYEKDKVEFRYSGNLYISISLLNLVRYD